MKGVTQEMVTNKTAQNKTAQDIEDDVETWEEIEPPLPIFLSWGEKPGQELRGKITHITPDGGKDFTGNPCPQYEFLLLKNTYSENKAGERTDLVTGETILLNVTSISLQRHLRYGNPKVDDDVSIIFHDTVKVDKGTAKQFRVRIRRS
jgi:hypothetical protein